MAKIVHTTTLTDEQFRERLKLLLDLVWNQCTTSLQRERWESEAKQREMRKQEYIDRIRRGK